MNLFRLLCLLLALPALLPAAASSPITHGAVTATLISDTATIAPGQTFTVALRLQHEPHWHSYWIAPGTGYPTSLTWNLPAGFTASDIQWPVPHVVHDAAGTITGNGYEATVDLLVAITPPPTLTPGTTVTLAATADWLMCKEVCMPGHAPLEITFPVTDQPRRDEHWTAALTAAHAQLPRAATGWSTSATRTDHTITLQLVPTRNTTHQPRGLHFFSTENLIDYAATQTVTAGQGEGAWVITMIPEATADKTTARLTGVLVATNGWSDGEAYGGLLIDAPFAEPAIGPDTATGKPHNRLAIHAPAPTTTDTLLPTLLLAFVGGMILNLMPCVFPVLGIKILGFVNQSGHDRRKITQHGLVFALGVLVSFWTLAAALLILRSGGAQLGWGFQLQSPAFVFAMAVFLLIFALNMSGLFEVGLATTGVGSTLQMRSGYAGSFFTGALATLVATPCSAPFLAPALGAALALPAGQSFLVFTAIAIGLALPYLLLSIFPQAIKLLPKPGAWMETFKQFMAFPLYATVGWLLWVLAGQTKDDDNALLLITFGFVLVAMAAWVYGRFGQAHGKPTRQRLGYLAAALLLIGGLKLGWPKPAIMPPTDGAYQVVWEKWSPTALATAQAAGRYVYVDFTARWCATCQTNKAVVFHNDAVLAELKKKNVLLLRADWTNRDPLITAELARWNRSAVPFSLIYAPGQPNPTVLPELLTPDKVLAGFTPTTQ